VFLVYERDDLIVHDYLDPSFQSDIDDNKSQFGYILLWIMMLWIVRFSNKRSQQILQLKLNTSLCLRQQRCRLDQ
jgi:hypothetical protein